MFPRFIAQFDERLQSDLRIAQVGHQSSDLAHRTILAGVAIFPDLHGRQPHRRAQFFHVLPRFVHSDAALFGRVFTPVKGGVDLFPKNPFESF
jgi:hypothetical protein